MKKISIDECLKECSVTVATKDALKEINGGCTFKVGRCLKDGTGFIMIVYVACPNSATYASHASKAKSWAVTNLAKGATCNVVVDANGVRVTS